MTRPVVIRKRSTLAKDMRRAPVLESIAREAIAKLLTACADHDRAGLSRALVQEAVRSDGETRGRHEAATWASAQARKVDASAPSPRDAAEALFPKEAA